MLLGPGLAWGGERVAAAGEIVAFNSLSWPRNDAVTGLVPTAMLPLTGVSGGDRAAAQTLVEPLCRTVAPRRPRSSARGDGQTEIVFTPHELPATGYLRLALRPAAATAETSLRVSPRQIENRFFRVELDDEGNLVRLLDKLQDRAIVPTGQRANELQLFQDGPEREAAWNIHATFEKRTYAGSRGRRLRSSRPGQYAP